MLRAVESGAAVVVCSTCRHSAGAREDASGRRGGALLAAAMRTVQQEEPELAGVAVQEMPWPLIRMEVEGIAGSALRLLSFEDFLDQEAPPVRRFRAAFRRD